MTMAVAAADDILELLLYVSYDEMVVSSAFSRTFQFHGNRIDRFLGAFGLFGLDGLAEPLQLHPDVFSSVYHIVA